jgi:excinuclease UvrABC nuclease subunit
MILSLEWTRAILLKDATRENLIYSLPFEKVPNASGIYVLGRRFGSNFEALYVGKATRIRGRVKSQCNNLRLMQHLKNAKSGKRILLAAKFNAKPGQKTSNCLTLVERALIRYFLSEGHDLVNKQGVRLRRHEIISSGKYPKRYFASPIFLEK